MRPTNVMTRRIACHCIRGALLQVLLPLRLLVVLLACRAWAAAICPTVCRCPSGDREVDCEGNGLTAVPGDVDTGVAILHFNGNRLTALGRVSI